ncbi:hypothetical protein BKG89_08540 [Rodentibacter caecimuris]|uniref:Uncharacterized protein n=1 Tax=Rodentibacter caecimuris TaxID=1796644 RepID=A0ABX3KVM8_9PAST|nr:hypothetical protein BKG89_08540 [Rodentibacter heylii]
MSNNKEIFKYNTLAFLTLFSLLHIPLYSQSSVESISTMNNISFRSIYNNDPIGYVYMRKATRRNNLF